jgi:hypothetical protein
MSTGKKTRATVGSNQSPAPKRHPDKGMDESAIPTWQSRWKTFLRKHRSWWSQFSEGQPTYTLPKEIVDALSRSASETGRKPVSPPVIGEKQAEAEHAFRTLCQERSTASVGVWRDETVQYDLLGPSVEASLAERWMGEARLDQFPNFKPCANPGFALTSNLRGHCERTLLTSCRYR